MLSSEQRVQIRHWFYAETLESWHPSRQELGVHPRQPSAMRWTPSNSIVPRPLRPLVTDPYVEFLRQTLQKYPPAACHAHLPDDPGSAVYNRKCCAVATRG